MIYAHLIIVCKYTRLIKPLCLLELGLLVMMTGLTQIQDSNSVRRDILRVKPIKTMTDLGYEDAWFIHTKRVTRLVATADDTQTQPTARLQDADLL